MRGGAGQTERQHVATGTQSPLDETYCGLVWRRSIQYLMMYCLPSDFMHTLKCIYYDWSSKYTGSYIGCIHSAQCRLGSLPLFHVLQSSVCCLDSSSITAKHLVETWHISAKHNHISVSNTSQVGTNLNTKCPPVTRVSAQVQVTMAPFVVHAVANYRLIKEPSN